LRKKEEKNVRWKEGYKQKNYQTGLNFTYLDCILSIVCAELGGLLPVAVLFAFASISCITRAFERVRAAAEPPPPSSLIFFFDDNSPPFWAFSLLPFKIEEETISLFSFKTLWSWQQTTTFIRGSIVLSLR